MPHQSTILIIGGGPVGLFLALRLAQSNISVTLLEAHSSIPADTKAMTHMPAVFPEFEKAGVYDDLKTAAKGLTNGKIWFRRGSDKSIIGASPAIASTTGPMTVPQQRFCEILTDHLGSMQNAKVLMGHKAKNINLTKSPKTVHVTAETASGAAVEFTASWLIGADGGKSVTRRLAGLEMQGETLPRKLVSTDVYYPFESYGWSGGNFLADPENFGLIGPITEDGLWRVSFGVPENYTTADIEKVLPQKFDAMFPGPRPLEYKVERCAPFGAHQLCAEKMRKGRVLLVGDAAHLTNPYAGMGLASGILDAASLTDVLVSHLQHGANEKVLDAWAQARRDNFRNVVDPLSKASFWALQDPDVESLPERHPIPKSLKSGTGVSTLPFATDVRRLSGYVA
ncbi:FAD/NAD(P)-binding domain-containing protein [Lophium mytilinum]|uniref:FAD/NAD(P)-binding domain-containing protein n=1 Tax=Lophium mytilinum TaxID=390894 RepID=A0A6A6R9I9_9PEZI|nr:FAD/NAD(P)-binding domain-containing protein [Lophium mytilinum]